MSDRATPDGPAPHVYGGDFDVELWPGDTIHVDSEEAAAEVRHYRHVLGRFATGVTVVTAVSGERPVGLTCQSFMSVSLDPPLVVFSPARISRAWPLIEHSGAYCVNVLAADQADLSEQMASHTGDKFAGVPWRPSPVTGSPVLEGALAYVDCRIHAVHEAGDHRLVVGRVVDLAATDGPDALTYYQGRYGSLD